MIQVTQADREAAADYEQFMLNDVNSYIRGIRRGKYDSHPLVQAFANRRLQARKEALAEAAVAAALAYADMCEGADDAVVVGAKNAATAIADIVRNLANEES